MSIRPSNDQTKKILIVDDEDSLRELFEMALYDADRETTVCACGKEALEVMKEKNFDLILLDLRMPNVSGIDVLREMRESGNKTRVILFSAYIPAKAMIQALSFGVTLFLNKPVTLEILRKAVDFGLKEHMDRDFADALEEAEKLNFANAVEVIESKPEMRRPRRWLFGRSSLQHSAKVKAPMIFSRTRKIWRASSRFIELCNLHLGHRAFCKKSR